MDVATLPRKVFDGYGFSQRSVSGFLEPRSADELADIFARASEAGVRVAMRGAGRSYGDAALNGGALILDMQHMQRVLSWDKDTGVIEVEPGVTVRQLWQHVLADGWWPPVVSGTAAPTLGGAVAMNIHGKNHFRMGGIGDHVLDLDLVTPSGQRLTLSRDQDPELFHGVISGFGMLGAITRVRIQMKKVYSDKLRVWQVSAPDLRAQTQYFDEYKDRSDYLVTWVDCIGGGGALGRGQIHRAEYLRRDEDPAPNFDPAAQDLPGHIMGVPKSLVPKILRVFSFNLGMQFVNLVKYLASWAGPNKPYLQGHAAFHFLLDYVPNFRSAYEPGGFIQYQPFVPRAHAVEVFEEILRRTQAAGLVSYLGVLKRYRPDAFLLSHALDGYSLAMDFPVTASNRRDLWALMGTLNDLVVEAGGRFYPAKDSVMRPQDFNRAWGQERISQFRRLRERVDPERVLRTELAERIGVDSGDLGAAPGLGLGDVGEE
ncbi:MAG: FAD-binding oxidoreductase [Alphaproteobacteria bacterium]|nr:FAD-binding oxidoreductase [Alphaproteobacteria bacterium]MCB9792773.1 FAD-binding oxidoreductase [Alphaproteobacteria bacterium]